MENSDLLEMLFTMKCYIQYMSHFLPWPLLFCQGSQYGRVYLPQMVTPRLDAHGRYS